MMERNTDGTWGPLHITDTGRELQEGNMEGYEIVLSGINTLEEARELDSKIFAAHEKESNVEIIDRSTGLVVPWGDDA